MGARWVIWLWLSLGCSQLFAQQGWLANGASGNLETARAVSMPLDGQPRSASISAILALTLRRPSTLYQAPYPQSPEIACTEARTPVITAAVEPYAFDPHNFTPAAVRSAFTHENMVKMATNFVPGKPLPDAPSYVALSPREKFDLFLKESHSFDTLSGVMIDALYAQATGAYPRFGGGMEGFGHRVGASMAGTEAAALLGRFVFPTLMHQDPRYFRSQQKGTSMRLAYAASRVLIGRSDDGRSVINTSLIFSEFAQAALTNAYIPYRNKSVSGTLENGLASLGSMAEANILREFWPDIKTFFSKRKAQVVQHWQPPQDGSSSSLRPVN